MSGLLIHTGWQVAVQRCCFKSRHFGFHVQSAQGLVAVARQPIGLQIGLQVGVAQLGLVNLHIPLAVFALPTDVCQSLGQGNAGAFPTAAQLKAAALLAPMNGSFVFTQVQTQLGRLQAWPP